MSNTPETFNSPRHAISFLLKNSKDIFFKRQNGWYELYGFARGWSVEENAAYSYLTKHSKHKMSFNGYIFYL